MGAGLLGAKTRKNTIFAYPNTLEGVPPGLREMNLEYPMKARVANSEAVRMKQAR